MSKRRTMRTVLEENNALKNRLAESTSNHAPISISTEQRSDVTPNSNPMHALFSQPTNQNQGTTSTFDFDLVSSTPESHNNSQLQAQATSNQPDASLSISIPPVGQLSIGSGGRSKFYGPTAAAHVLPDEWEDHDRDRDHVALERSADTLVNEHEGTASTTASASATALTFPLLRPSASARKSFLDDASRQIPDAASKARWIYYYWNASSWRYEPITKEYFDRMLLGLSTTGSSNSTSRNSARVGAQLAVLFAVLAIGCLFDPDLPPHSDQAQKFDDLSMSCLTAAEFMTNTSVPSLISLHLHCCFLLNDSRPRTDEIYVLVGLALRLATMAGFHRDGTWWDLPQGEVDARRRVWWEILTLERVNSNRFGCPSFINFGQFDALRPSDQSSESFLYWRWEYDNILHTLINSIDSIRSSPNLEGLQEADTLERGYWERVPVDLKPAGLPPWIDDITVRNTLQQHRLALHYYTGLLQLHRLGMNRALRTHGNEPLNSQFAASVKVVVEEACKNVLELVDAVYKIDSINSRHMVIALDLFSTLVPQAALVIRSPRSSLATLSHHQLIRGVDLLEKATKETPCAWYSGLLQRGQKLAAKATSSLAMRWGTDPSVTNGEQDGVETLLGDITQLHQHQHSAVPTPVVGPSAGAGTALAEDLEFERWISSLIEDGPFMTDPSWRTSSAV
ncbi:uncharacterized protein I303_105673 [Kwoniella dejecticola CBS 10117]|uniref:Xylanolytic transcriptional activator regulatory domain-containing protein n=1 Tax=Kwoniella dejecticola CBS 10117 TaxID=1296121 RepID=A0A1A6A035_9TREE|nr:uncharacterized protein I303_05695 [Kwoniella dejecticola CBS 10117]OBR83417.1 hypothetical protein I303_05695 [Kwoniella dejecticola CBS 10117]